MKLHLFIFDVVGSDIVLTPMCTCGYKFKHPIHLQHNGEVCDVLMFPCTCGSWHSDTYEADMNIGFMERISTPGYQPSEMEAIVIKVMTDGQ
jgi:hypothetical protein